MTEQEAKEKVNLKLLGRSIGSPSDCRVVLDIIWNAALKYAQNQAMPEWMQYDPATEVLTIHGKRYAAALFGRAGFLGEPGDLFRIEKGSDDVVTVSKVQTALEYERSQPAQEPDYWLGYGLQAHTKKPFDGATELFTKHARSQPVQEPAAWQFFCENEKKWFNGSELHNHRKNTEQAGYKIRNLYAAPPAAQINEQLLSVLRKAEDAMTWEIGGEPCGLEDSLVQVRAAIAAAKEHEL